MSDEIIKRLDGLKAGQDTLVEGQVRIEIRLEGVESRLGAVEIRQEGVESRLGAVETRLEGVESRLGGVEGRLGALESNLTDLRRTTTDSHGMLLDMVRQAS